MVYISTMTKSQDKDIRIELVSQEEVSVCGGVVLFKQLMERFKIRELLRTLPFPASKHKNSYDSQTVIETFLVNVWLGGDRFVHCEAIRRDRVLRQTFGWRRVPSASTISRFFNRFTYSINHKVFPALFKHVFGYIDIEDGVIVDIDSHVITRYGMIEGAEVGYNPKKPGRRSHHAIVAFIDKYYLCVNGWLRRGDTTASSNVENFIGEVLDILGDEEVSLVRADSGFCNQRSLEALEKHDLKYVVRARMTKGVKRVLLNMLQWREVADGIEVGEGELKLWNWRKGRRVVAIRFRKGVYRDARGKRLLIEGEDLSPQWTYQAFVTNTDLDPYEVWELYRGRANVENRIKELVYDFGIDQFNVRNFWGTEAAFRLCLFAYNIVSLLRLVGLRTQKAVSFKNLRSKIVFLSSRLVTHSGNTILKIGVSVGVMKFLRMLLENIHNLSPPVKIFAM